MSTAIVCPPSQRNFQVHYFLQEGGTTREAAARFGISQTRVRQVARQVVKWAAQVLPVESEAEAAGLARVAQSVAADRLEHFYQQTMREWNATHQPKFLNLALRVTMATVKMPRRAYEIGAAEADLFELEEESGSKFNVQSSKSEDDLESTLNFEPGTLNSSHPVGACSEDDAVADESSARAEQENGANASGRRLSGLLRKAPQPALAALSPPARSLLSAGEEQAITQLTLTRDMPGASIECVLSPPQRELSRNERRRLRKKLKRAKGLAG